MPQRRRVVLLRKRNPSAPPPPPLIILVSLVAVTAQHLICFCNADNSTTVTDPTDDDAWNFQFHDLDFGDNSEEEDYSSSFTSSSIEEEENGGVDFITNFSCPPQTVSSLKEVAMYCDDCMQSIYDYECLDRGKTVCKGKVDRDMDVPTCSKPVISSCDDYEYYSICSKEKQGDRKKVCDQKEFASRNYDKKFACWDQVEDQWCEGSVEPTKGTWWTPVCPVDTTVTSCDALADFGIHPRNCNCHNLWYEPQYSYELGGPFHCTKEGEVWCHGAIAPTSQEENNGETCPPRVVSSCAEVSLVCGTIGEYKCVTDLRDPNNFDDYWETGTYSCWSPDGALTCSGMMKRDGLVSYPECPSSVTLLEAEGLDLGGCSMHLDRMSWQSSSTVGSYSCTYKNGHECLGDIIPTQNQLVEGFNCPPAIATSWDEVRDACGTAFKCTGKRKRGSTSSSGTSNCFNDANERSSGTWMYGYYECYPSEYNDTTVTCIGIVDTLREVSSLSSAEDYDWNQAETTSNSATMSVRATVLFFMAAALGSLLVGRYFAMKQGTAYRVLPGQYQDGGYYKETEMSSWRQH